MIKNPTLGEFSAMATTRVLCERMIDRRAGSLRELFTYEELLTQGVYAANDILKDIGANRECWVRVRGRRAYLFHESTNRIMAEFGVVSEAAERGMRRRPQYLLLGKRGAMNSPTVGDLIVTIAKLGATGYQRRPKRNNNHNERRNYGNHQNNPR
jgi:hypothetical protein